MDAIFCCSVFLVYSEGQLPFPFHHTFINKDVLTKIVQGVPPFCDQLVNRSNFVQFVIPILREIVIVVKMEVSGNLLESISGHKH